MTRLQSAVSCTDYKRQRCSNKWRYYCQGSNRVRRGVSRGRTPRLFWGKLEKLFQLLSPRSDPVREPVPEPGGEEEVESQSDDVKCWRLVRECQWVTYNTVCANKPTTVCQPLCREECQQVEYCSTCPQPPGPPSPPPPGSLLILPPAPPPPVLLPELIDA